MREAWAEYTVRELLERVKRPLPVNDDASYLQIGIRSFGRGFFHKPSATSHEIGNKKLFSIEPGDLVFNIVFAWEGAVALAGPRESGTCGSHRFPTYRPCKELWLPRYAELFFQSPSGVGLLREASPGSAGRNKTLNQERLLSFRVRVPSLSEQQTVVDLIDAVDIARRANAIYAQRLTNVLEELREDMVERQGYEIASLASSLVSIKGGKSPQAENRLPGPGERAVLKVSAVKPGFFDVTGVKTLPDAVAMPDRALVEDGDLLITRANTAALVGAVCLVERAPEAFYLCDKTLRLTLNEQRLSKRFAVHALATRRVRTELLLLATGSSASMKNVSQQKLRSLEVALPTIPEQDRIATALDLAFRSLRLLRAKNAALETFRARALPVWVANGVEDASDIAMAA